MVRLSFAVFALAGLATASASAADNAHSRNARSLEHSKMVKVRSPAPAPVPSPVASNSTSTGSKELIQAVPRASSDGHDWKRDIQRFTYYEVVTGNQVACGGWHADTDYIVALNSPQFGNGENCNKVINIWFAGKQTQAQIVDECPGCPEGGLDMSPSLFEYFADLSVGVIYGAWWFA